MGEEVRMTEYEINGNNNDEETNGDDERILDWEMGLPNGDELTPLSQSLIPLELASAFSISPIHYRTAREVNKESHRTLSSIRGSQSHTLSSNNNNIKSFNDARDPMVLEADETEQNGSGSESRKSRKPDCTEEADSALRTENSADDPSARTLKRPRLVWTPQLHKRFVDVVGHLGIKNAVPKTIMQLMNVEGLTRENVASHLQKYRLYLKRMQGLSNDDPSPSDQLFSSTPVPPQLHYESGGGGGGNSNNNISNSNGNGHVPGPYGAPAMMSVPMYGMMSNGFHPAHGFEQNMYNMNMSMNMNMNMGMNNMLQQRDWSVNKHGSVVSYQHHVAPSSDK